MSGPGSGGALPPAPDAPEVPAGAMCAVHPERAAAFLCARCGCFGCPSCAFSGPPIRPTCDSCAALGLGEPIPWERQKELGRVRAFWATTKLAATQPTRFFRTPQTERSAMRPALYGVLVYLAGQLGYYAVTAVILLVGGSAAAFMAPDPEAGGFVLGYFGCLTVGMLPLILLQAPVYALMGIVGGGGLTHGTLVLLRSRGAGFEQTLRAVSFANAPSMLYFVPCLGWVVGYVWMLVLEVVAIRETHQISTARAAVAVLGYRTFLTVAVGGVYAALLALSFALGEGR